MTSLVRQKVTETKRAYFELKPDHFIYNVEFKADVPKDDNIEDDKLLTSPDMWEERRHSYEILILRKNIVATEMFWNAKNSQWRIDISISGMEDDLRLYFYKRAACKEVKIMINNWLLGREEFKN